MLGHCISNKTVINIPLSLIVTMGIINNDVTIYYVLQNYLRYVTATGGGGGGVTRVVCRVADYDDYAL